MHLRFLAILSLIGTLMTGPALADDRYVVVVELFTSQGCSSCPPADALVDELAEREGILPLALHVDYWDYIGWADSFARPQNTKRQKAYARMAHSASIYTPQMVVGGVDHVVGYKPMRLMDLVRAHAEVESPVDISVEPTADGVRILSRGRDGAKLPRAINIDLVGFVREASVDIDHGENAGKTIKYANIVQSWDRLGTWDGTGDFEILVTLPGEASFALLVQAKGPGRILAALRLR
jgi:hypothetical protein